MNSILQGAKDALDILLYAALVGVIFRQGKDLNLNEKHENEKHWMARIATAVGMCFLLFIFCYNGLGTESECIDDVNGPCYTNQVIEVTDVERLAFATKSFVIFFTPFALGVFFRERSRKKLS